MKIRKKASFSKLNKETQIFVNNQKRKSLQANSLNNILKYWFEDTTIKNCSISLNRVCVLFDIDTTSIVKKVKEFDQKTRLELSTDKNEYSLYLSFFYNNKTYPPKDSLNFDHAIKLYLECRIFRPVEILENNPILKNYIPFLIDQRMDYLKKIIKKEDLYFCSQDLQGKLLPYYI